MQDQPAAGWYPDPTGKKRRSRYWDGEAWTGKPRLGFPSGPPVDILGFIALVLGIGGPILGLFLWAEHSGVIGTAFLIVGALCGPVTATIAIRRASRDHYSRVIGMFALGMWIALVVFLVASIAFLMFALANVRFM